METFKFKENYGSHCNECGKTTPGKTSYVLEINGVSYTLCENCYKKFIGALYLAKPEVFEELIGVLAKKDRAKILGIVNKV